MPEIVVVDVPTGVLLGFAFAALSGSRWEGRRKRQGNHESIKDCASLPMSMPTSISISGAVGSRIHVRTGVNLQSSTPPSRNSR